MRFTVNPSIWNLRGRRLQPAMLVAHVRPGNPRFLGFRSEPDRSTLAGMTLRERDRGRARERLEALASAPADPEETQRAAIAVLRRAVGFERWCWPRTDPGSGLATGGTADFDLWHEIPRMAALEEHGDVTRKPALVVGRRASVSLSAETGGDLARSARWRECLGPYGVGDELMTVCRDEHGCWGSVELMRDSDDPPFAEDDVAWMHELAPTLGRLLRRSLPRDRADGGAAGALPPATLIVDADLQLRSWTPTLVPWLGELGASAERGELPPAVFEVAARVLTPAASATGLPPSARLRTPTGRWLTIEGAPLEGSDRGGVAVTIRAASTNEVFDVLCRTYELSRRERELVALMLDGLATKQLAAALCVSPHTVQDHLKAVFRKTGLRSRREVVSHLAGQIPAQA
jgi:DNA-binding CsgD family transcriptional regulator